MKNCSITTPKALRPELSSLFMAAIAAIQGVYKRVKDKKPTAVTGVNNVFNDAAMVSVEVPNRTLKVLTTASFAVIPVIRAVETLQSSKPIGLNIGAIVFPIRARRLSELLLTTLNRISKVCKNHIITEATKITVKALCKKSLALSHINNTTVLKEGRR